MLPSSTLPRGGLQDNSDTDSPLVPSQLEASPLASSVELESRGLSAPELSDLVLQAIVVNRGVSRAAAEWLKNHHGIELDPLTLVDHLEGRLPELKEKMELVATLDLFSTLPQVKQAFISQIGDLDPAASSRAYMDLLKLIQTSVSKNELNINVHEEIWHRAPRQVQRLFAQLEAAGQLDALDALVIDHDPDLDDQVA